MKIFKRLDNCYNFETFEFDTKFHSREKLFDITYNIFDYYDRFIQEADYFADDEVEITNEEFTSEYDKLVDMIRKSLNV